LKSWNKSFNHISINIYNKKYALKPWIHDIPRRWRWLRDDKRRPIRWEEELIVQGLWRYQKTTPKWITSRNEGITWVGREKSENQVFLKRHRNQRRESTESRRNSQKLEFWLLN